jgi:hypothetical protein
LAQSPVLKVTVELGELRHVVEGSPETVIEELIRFISRVIPQYDVAARIIFAPDYAQLLDDLSLRIKVSAKGDILLEEANLAAERAVLFVLAGAHVAKRFGKRESDDVIVDEVARAVGKASKTIRNTLANLQKSGYVERIARGSYRITTTGLRQVQSNPPEPRREVEASTEVEVAKT